VKIESVDLGRKTERRFVPNKFLPTWL